MTTLKNRVDMFSDLGTNDSKLFHQGLSHQGLSHQGLSHQGLSHQGLSHQGLSHQGLSHQGLSHQGLSHKSLSHKSLYTIFIKEEFDKYTFLDIYNDGGINAIYKYIGECDKCHDFKKLRQFFLNYNLCDHIDNYPNSLRYSSGIVREKSDIDTLFQIVILPMHYGEMYRLGQSLPKKYNVKGGAAAEAAADAAADAVIAAEEKEEEEAEYVDVPINIALGTFNTLESIARYCNDGKDKGEWTDTNIGELCNNLNNHVDFRDGETETIINLEGTIECPGADLYTLGFKSAPRVNKSFSVISVFLANIILDSYHDHKKIFKKSNFDIIGDCIKELLLKNKTKNKKGVLVNKIIVLPKGGADNIINEIKSYIRNVVHYNYFKKNAKQYPDKIKTAEEAAATRTALRAVANKYIVLNETTFKLPLKIDKYHYNYLFEWYEKSVKSASVAAKEAPAVAEWAEAVAKMAAAAAKAAPSAATARRLTKAQEASAAADAAVGVTPIRSIQLPPIGNWRVNQEIFDTTTCILDQYSNPNGGFLINSGNVEINVANAIDPGESFRKSIYPKEYIDAILYNIFDIKKKYIIDNSTYKIKFNYNRCNLLTCHYYLDEDLFKLDLIYSGDDSITNSPPFLPTVYSNSTVDTYYNYYKAGMTNSIKLNKTGKKLRITEIKDILLSIIIRKFMGDFGQMLYCSIPNVKLNKDIVIDKDGGAVDSTTKFIPFKVEGGEIIHNESIQHHIEDLNGTKIFMTGDRAAINSGLLISILKEKNSNFNLMKPSVHDEGYYVARHITINSNLHSDFRMFNAYNIIDETNFYRPEPASAKGDDGGGAAAAE
jgi:hypothetical protein